MKTTVNRTQEGMLLRDFLRHEVSVSHALLVQLKQKTDGILLNGAHATVRAVLHTGDAVELSIDDDAQAGNIVPRDLPLDLLYEDSSLFVFNKAGGMPTHPSNGHYEDSLANAVAFLYQKRGIPFVFRPVNRLDAGTSGIVLLAKDQHAAHLLSGQIAEHRMKKKYYAVVQGCLTGCGTLDTGFRRKDGSVLMREVYEFPISEAERAITQYDSLFASKEASLLALTPHTGRTHQLRVHCAYLGHPILGDWLYGTEEPDYARPMLHAVALSFISPSAGAVTVTAPLPEDFCRCCRKLGLCLPDDAALAL